MTFEELLNKYGPSFSFESHNVTISVNKLNIPGSITLSITFSSNRRPIIITLAEDANKNKFWTTIPDGLKRQKEAKGVAILIEEYLNSKE